ncbi:response regulator transcription factor [Microbacterium oxydans]|uniref:response regulator transcription factor n=1 Tax=Microbacterium oxydans TaxID=82380 RepID=UPI00226B6253|nr:response regulator transcription factor [Microbacterium oxydans]WAA65547.1 response regulator transcription factor [Microbacterium oxydans]
MKVMLVDDDADICLGFTTALRRRGHAVETAEDVASARLLAERSTPDVAIIDVMLPDGDGFALCREIRARWGFPTVMLTARDEDADIVVGLDAGADDYISKPVSVAVLEARLRSVLRRSARPADEALRVGELELLEASVEAKAAGRVLPLSATEFRLLHELALNDGHALSRSRLIDAVWAQSPPDTPRVVDTAVQRLRAKLTAAKISSPQLETVRGIGYRLR